ncbi:MAG: GntR family transcriptional regulator [Halomonas sp.]|nr:GntR family transcriptional regulator [Halomonas sp.]TVP49396.1 MAG: GntR family transcriptional regulator [Halomonas sp.]
MLEKEKVDKLLAPEKAYVMIRQAILAGEYAPNDRLREDELATRVGVSRTPIRSALQRLVQDGFVVFHPNSGAAVRGWSRQDAVEIFQVRASLESLGASLAVSSATPGDIRELEALCDGMEDLRLSEETVEELSVLNRKFHMKILRMSRNRKLEETALSLMDVGFLIRSYRNFSVKDEQRSLFHHRDLVSAFAAKNAEWASAIMKSHILAASDIVRDND